MLENQLHTQTMIQSVLGEMLRKYLKWSPTFQGKLPFKSIRKSKKGEKTHHTNQLRLLHRGYLVDSDKKCFEVKG